jgi:hypothetical protein
MGRMIPSNKQEALLLGVKTYFTGIPCKRGGIAHRRLNGDCLCDACKLAIAQIKSNWFKNNKDKNIAWAKANPEKMIAYKKKYEVNNSEKIEQYRKQWKSLNKNKVLSNTHKRQASKLNATPLWFNELDEFVISEAIDLATIREKTTGIKWHVDHMIPLKAKEACGLHCADNIQVIPASINLMKNNKLIYTVSHEWIKTL